MPTSGWISQRDGTGSSWSSLKMMLERPTRELCSVWPDLTEQVSPFINWSNPFLNSYLQFQCTFVIKQIVLNLIRRHIMRCLIWFCTVCLCPIKSLMVEQITFKEQQSVNIGFNHCSQLSGVKSFVVAQEQPCEVDS